MIANRELIADMTAKGGSSRELNDALYPQVAAGNKAARDKMIEINMPLVVAKVDQYVKQFPEAAYLHDDLVSAGFVGLTESVNKLATAGPRDNPNATGYMSTWIQRRIGEVMDGETGIGSPRTQQLARQFNRQLPKQVEVGDLLMLTDSVPDPTRMLELLRDLIDACCETEEDTAIVDLREKGYTDREIATQLSLPYTTTYMMRREIYRRFLEMSEYRGEV